MAGEFMSPERNIGGEDNNLEQIDPPEVQAQKLAQQIADVLKNDLKEKNVQEKTTQVPLLYQEYSTDRGIACDRMALAYFGFEDDGTDNLVDQAKEMGLDYLETKGADNLVGPADHPEDPSDFKRNHAVVVKGYKVNDEGGFSLVVNDPKQNVGGKLKVGQELLGKALVNNF